MKKQNIVAVLLTTLFCGGLLFAQTYRGNLAQPTMPTGGFNVKSSNVQCVVSGTFALASGTCLVSNTNIVSSSALFANETVLGTVTKTQAVNPLIIGSGTAVLFSGTASDTSSGQFLIYNNAPLQLQ